MPTATCDRGSRTARGWLAVALGTVLALVVALVPARPALASSVVQPVGIALSISATCEQGDVQITYAADGVARQAVAFTSETGTVLDAFETDAYKPVYDGTEHILTDAEAIRPGLPTPRPVPAAGTVLGVYVTLGETPPVATNGEFFLLYRCDTQRNDKGGGNVVLMTCVGDDGTCPKTAQEAMATPATQPSTTVPVAPPGGAVVPKFTG